MSTYYYPQVSTDGYRWNMLQRCLYEVGLEPIGSGDVGTQTYLEFSRDLTAAEKTKLDTLMSDNPTFPPSGGGGFIIKDIYENFTQFKVDAKLPNLQLYYTQSQAGGAVNQVHLWNPVVLTNANKNNINQAYLALKVTV